MIIEFNRKIAIVQEELLKESQIADNDLRKLITAQGSELVNKVCSCFEMLGFVVHDMDAQKEKGQIKLEDIRIQDTDDPGWEAIVEVKGFAKSGGGTDDLLKIARFVRHYQAEKGKYPDKRIYIVNGQTDLAPSQRQAPLASSPNDVTEFGEQDGVIIWSLDLFRLIKNIDRVDIQAVKKSIKDAKGRFVFNI